MLHLHRGTPFVYQGDELGWPTRRSATSTTSATSSRQRYRAVLARGADPDEAMAAIRYKGRDNARTPMQWDASEHAGFTTGSPWLAVIPTT